MSISIIYKQPAEFNLCSGVKIKPYIFLLTNILSMLDAQQITLRFLEIKLQVHPDVVRYIQEKNEPNLIERIIAQVPGEAIVVSAKHIPGMTAHGTGHGFSPTHQLK